MFIIIIIINYYYYYYYSYYYYYYYYLSDYYYYYKPWLSLHIKIATARIEAASRDRFSCNHIFSSESRQSQSNLVQVLKQLVVTSAVVTVCWPYEECGSFRIGRTA